MRPAKVVVAILTDWEQMNLRILASKSTWIKQLSYDIFYFVGRSKFINETLIKDVNVVVLPCDDKVYPPVDKTYSMWHYLFANYVMNYDYFVAVDSDTYVNVKQLEALISMLTCRDCYVGYASPGGNSTWRNRTGVQAPYCQGMGYIISQSTLLQLGPNLNSCRTSFPGRHSDTEIARCIYKYVHKLSCSHGKIRFKMVVYTINEKNQKVKLRLNARKQMDINFPAAPSNEFFRAVMVHPLKKPQYFYRFHQQVVQNLRPILPPLFAPGSCVANPILQQEVYSQNKPIPECSPLKITKVPDIKSLNAFIISQSNNEERILQLINTLQKHGLQVQRFQASNHFIRPNSTKLKDDQWQLRLLMIQFFHWVLSANLERVIVFEDNAIPHHHFGSRLQHLLLDSRCAGHIFRTDEGGITMLGATIWAQGWRILEKFSTNETGQCRNICSHTFGSFAVIYHRATFESILTWLNTTIDVPYDHVFSHLSREGYPVRFALPNLVIKDVTLTSVVHRTYHNNDYYNLTKRAIIHRWNLHEYLLPQHYYI